MKQGFADSIHEVIYVRARVVAVAINCWRTANGGNGKNSFELGEFLSDFCLMISAFCLRQNLTKERLRTTNHKF